MKDLLKEEQLNHPLTRQHKVRNYFVRPGWRIPAVIYEPADKTGNADIAILVMHSDEDYLSFSAGEELAKRGFCVMCANVSAKFGDLDHKLRDAGTCFELMKDIFKAKTNLLLGHSGGGTLMSAYQSIAENGPSIYQSDSMLKKCPDDLAGLSAADGLLLLDSNWGNAAMRLFSMDPAITDESDSHSKDPALDLFNPENGFRPGGSTYTEEFVKAFFRGEHERNTRLNEFVLSRIKAIEEGNGAYDDDEPLVVAGAEQAFFNNKLYAQDLRFMSVTRNPHTLLGKDGVQTHELIHSLRGPENDESFTTIYGESALVTTVRSYLSNFAIRTTDEFGFDESNVYGIDWDSNYNCTTGNIKHVSAPLLVMGMTGGWEFASAETIYENAGSADKTLAYVRGADHFFRPCTHLEKEPGEFGDTLKTTYDYVEKWINDRF